MDILKLSFLPYFDDDTYADFLFRNEEYILKVL